MAEANNQGYYAMRELLKANPHATPDEIREFADKHNFPISFSGPSDHDPGEPGFDKFTYTEADLEDMKEAQLRYDQEPSEGM